MPAERSPPRRYGSNCACSPSTRHRCRPPRYRRGSEGGSAASAAALRPPSRQIQELAPFPAFSRVVWRLLIFSSGNRNPPAGEFDEPGRRSSAPSSRAPPLTAQAEDKANRSEEHTSELQSRLHLVCRLLLEKKK